MDCRVFETADTFHLVQHHVPLIRGLGRIIYVLEMASTAASYRAEMRAARPDSLRGGFQQSHTLGKRISSPVIHYPRRDQLARDRIRHKDRASGVASQSPPTMYHLINLEFKTIVGQGHTPIVSETSEVYLNYEYNKGACSQESYGEYQFRA